MLTHSLQDDALVGKEFEDGQITGLPSAKRRIQQLEGRSWSKGSLGCLFKNHLVTGPFTVTTKVRQIPEDAIGRCFDADFPLDFVCDCLCPRFYDFP